MNSCRARPKIRATSFFEHFRPRRFFILGGGVPRDASENEDSSVSASGQVEVFGWEWRFLDGRFYRAT